MSAFRKLRLLVVLAAVPLQGADEPRDVAFRKITLTAEYLCDGINAADIDGDGHVDVIQNLYNLFQREAEGEIHVTTVRPSPFATGWHLPSSLPEEVFPDFPSTSPHRVFPNPFNPWD